jgi:predicted CXXCH cytochrome family protein
VTEAPAAPINFGWEGAQALGLAAVLLCLLLCALPVRPRALTSRTLSLGRHALLGWFALACALLHVGLALLTDKVAVEHVKPTAPLYEWAGMGALALLLFLTLPAGGSVRRRLWAGHRNFQALHVAAACLLVALIAVHVFTSARYVHGILRSVLFLALSGSALLALLRARARARTSHPALNWRTALVFGRHSAVVLAIVSVCVLALAALLLPGAALRLREPLLGRTGVLLLDFPHDKHREVNCITCHHNFVDATGTAACISCHRSSRADLKVGAEARFHDFCFGCHREPPPPLARHGPVTGCAGCHAAAHAT